MNKQEIISILNEFKRRIYDYEGITDNQFDSLAERLSDGVEIHPEHYLGWGEGNQLISEFIGDDLPAYLAIQSVRKYHTSWDWLMPSWGKLYPLLKNRNDEKICEGFCEAVVNNNINYAWELLIRGIKLIGNS